MLIFGVMPLVLRCSDSESSVASNGASFQAHSICSRVALAGRPCAEDRKWNERPSTGAGS
jgi:hypothetical protein